MPYTLEQQPEPCTVCGGEANLHQKRLGVGEIVDCSRCGDFSVGFQTVKQRDDLPYKNPKRRALASHIIQKLQAAYTRRTRPHLAMEFFDSLEERVLPSPAEALDNLILWLAEQAEGRPGPYIPIVYQKPSLLGIVGVVDEGDILWIVDSLKAQDLATIATLGTQACEARLTIRGWERVKEIKHAHTSSNYAFFARQFSSPDLDQVFHECLRQAVKDTGYELRTATQRAGLVDAVIEDEIRRCRFLIADLSDDNAGAYWEAGFAEGLGKPVIYICRARKADGTKKTTHFDTDHRHTVRWDLDALADTEEHLKAVINNTLLGGARQID